MQNWRGGGDNVRECFVASGATEETGATQFVTRQEATGAGSGYQVLGVGYWVLGGGRFTCDGGGAFEEGGGHIGL